MNVAFLTRYSSLGASSRVRAGQYKEFLLEGGIDVEICPLLDDSYLESRYSGRLSMRGVLGGYGRRLLELHASRKHDLIWIEKELFPYAPALFEKAVLGGAPFVTDFDDATFHTYDQAPSRFIRLMLGRKIDSLMAKSRAVIVGNRYLQGRAREAGARRIEVIPSVVDISAYPPPKYAWRQGGPFVVCWIGSPSTSRYLEVVRAPLERVSKEIPVELRVIGAEAPSWPGVSITSRRWDLRREATDLGQCDVGIMPLPDTPWERGKCGFKLIQYMASGLPVIASPVGANTDIVNHGVDGFLAASDEEWLKCLEELARDPCMRERLGRSGRTKVEDSYSVQARASQLIRVLNEAVSRPC